MSAASATEVLALLAQARAEALHASIDFAPDVLSALAVQESLAPGLAAAVQQAEAWLRILLRLADQVAAREAAAPITPVSLEPEKVPVALSTADWYASFSRALLNWQLEQAKTLTREAGNWLPPEIKTGIEALQAKTYTAAQPMIALLEGQATPGSSERTRLHAFGEALQRVSTLDHASPGTLEQSQGELLLALDLKKEAAEAFHEAGVQCINAGVEDEQNPTKHFKQAVVYFTQATATNADFAQAHWGLADAYLRLSSIALPAYVDLAALEQSETAWAKGLELARPNADNAWVYATRAGQMQQRAQHDPQHKARFLWEGVVFSERAVALAPNSAYNLGYLWRMYQDLGYQLNALHVLEQYEKRFPNNSRFSLEDKIINQANQGNFSEAERLLTEYEAAFSAKHNSDGNLYWAMAVRAYIAVRHGQYEKALELVTQAQASKDKSPVLQEPWVDDIRNAAFRMLVRRAEVLHHYQAMYAQRDTEHYQDSAASVAWAAFYTDHVTDAIEYATRAMTYGQDNPLSVQPQLALYYLAPGPTQDIDLARHLFATSIKETVNRRVIRDTLAFDLPDAMRFIDEKHWPEPEAIRVTLYDMVLLAQARLRELELRPPTAISELRYALETASDDWMRVAAHAGLARVYTDEERWRDAILTYDTLTDATSTQGNDPGSGTRLFPEAEIGRDRALDGFQSHVDTLISTARYSEAIEAVQFLLGYRKGNPEWQAALRARWEIARGMESGALAEALSRALTDLAPNNQTEGGNSLGRLLISIKPSPADTWRLHAVITGMIQDSPMSGAWEAARAMLVGYLAETFQLNGTPGDFVPVYNPITVELGSGLIPERTGVDEWVLFTEYIPILRDKRLLVETGVKAPGILVRGSNDPAPDRFIIFLDEVPVQLGSVELDKRFCVLSSVQLRELSLSADGVLPAVNPLTGEQGYWVPARYWPVLEGRIELWPEPLSYVVNALEATLRQNLDQFVGFQELSDTILPAWKDQLNDPGLLDRAVPEQAARLRLLWLLRQLAAEQVPILRGQAILETLLEAASDDLPGLLRAVRLRLRDVLPGNKPGLTIRELDVEWDVLLDSAAGAGAPIQALDRFKHQLRAWTQESQRLVLVARNAPHRLALWQLMHAEFPHVFTLSEEERSASANGGTGHG